ncbi:MAG: sulfite exporter TauE/SafE family protein [Melioribacteraceae bacterium]|nr:sulfite exporter TauE/SafE family protein [Melioribacteraceae bacterium]MDD3557791.1 sulfite exporter TauE/SafE family protein [Melioribacteraceae bacterium]
MDYLVIIVVALFVAGLTFFSGFGLGTLLLPGFAIFFPVEVAVAATAIVHFVNNIYKFILIGKEGNLKIILYFGIPAVIAAAGGAYLLDFVSKFGGTLNYSLFGYEFTNTPVKLMIAMLMIIFALFELLPNLRNFNVTKKWIPLGGILSGFFGGLSGHQGALRTAFLIRAGLEKKEFIGTIVGCSLLVDITRITVYGITFFKTDFNILDQSGLTGLLIAGSIAAFIGTTIGRYLLEKVTFKSIQYTVATMLFLLAIGLGLGII